MRTLSISATTVLSLLTALRLVHAQSGFNTESWSTPTPTSCPAAVSVQNGGFDSGLAPWATLPAAVPKPTFSVVSPGYNGGAHALQLEFPAANATSWYFLQDIGPQCKGEQLSTPPTALIRSCQARASTPRLAPRAGNTTAIPARHGRLATQHSSLMLAAKQTMSSHPSHGR
jgi:hypothetical protein